MPSASHPALRYLGPEDIAELAISPSELADAVASAFEAKARGAARTAHKLNLPTREGNFSAKGAVLDEAGLAVMKWYGYIPGNEHRGLPDFSPLVLLSDATNGWPRAILDGNWLSSARTAALSVAAARVLARPDASRIGFVACGALAHAHLQAFAAAFPLRSVTCCSRTPASAESLARTARESGLQAHVTSDPHEAVRAMDIVVSSVPRQAQPRAFLDACQLAPGAFAAMPCMGASWNMETLHAIDVLATDDADPTTGHSMESVCWTRPFHADLAQLLQEPSRFEATGSRRTAFMFAGSAIADAAAASLIWRRAERLGLGQLLPFGAAAQAGNYTGFARSHS